MSVLPTSEDSNNLLQEHNKYNKYQIQAEFNLVKPRILLLKTKHNVKVRLINAGLEHCCRETILPLGGGK